MDPYTSELLAGLHRAELLAEADRGRRSTAAARVPRRPWWPQAAWRERVGARLVEAGLHLLVAAPEPKPCC